MPYASLEDLIERAGETEIRQISDRDRTGMPNPDVVNAALVHADNIVNGYVATRYAVPLLAVPDLVRTWAISIARYFLHRMTAPEHVQADYKDALAALKDVASGRITLPVAPGVAPPEQASGRVMAAHPDRVFTSDRLRGWKPC